MKTTTKPIGNQLNGLIDLEVQKYFTTIRANNNQRIV
jgi:hypothetical protein